MSYPKRIIATLLHNSVAQTYAEAILEWSYTGICHSRGGDCQLCGKANLIYIFTIRNHKNQRDLEVGSECIHNYNIAGSIDVAADRKHLERTRRMEHDLSLLEQAARSNRWIAEHLASLRAKVQHYGRLTKRQRKIVKQSRSNL